MAALELAGDVFVADDDETLFAEAAGWVLARIRCVLAERERCSIALSGGSTPGPVYRELARAGAEGRYDGERIDLLLADERCVAPDDELSNARLVSDTWLDIDPSPTLIRPRGEEPEPVLEAGAYAAKLPPIIDLVILGVGEDGHTASLFPGSFTVREAERRVVYVDDAPKPPPQRWSLSPRSLEDARSLVTIVRGAAKADAVARALEGPWDPVPTPAQLARRGTWFLDRHAAQSLSHNLPTE